MPALQTQLSLFTWGLLIFFLLLSITLVFLGSIARKKNTSQIIPNSYWFFSLHIFNFFVALCFFYFLPAFCKFLPFIIALIYLIVGFIFGLPLLWVVGASTIAAWYVVQTVCFISAPFYLPESPFFYGIIGIGFCLLPFSTFVHERVDVPARAEITLGGAYFIISLFLFFQSYQNLLPQEIFSTLLFVLPVVLFIWGIDTLKKQPNSLSGECILFLAFHLSILCLLNKLLPYLDGAFPLVEYVIPFVIVFFFIVLAFYFASSSWWIMSMSIPGLWVPFLIRFLCNRPFFSWEIIILLFILGVIIVSSHTLFRRQSFIQEARKQDFMIAMVHFTVALLVCLKLLGGMY